VQVAAMVASSAVVLFLASISSVCSVKLLTKKPVWLGEACKNGDPSVNECLKNTFQNMFPYMAKGIPEVSVPRFEPLYIERIGLRKGHGPVTLAGNFNNLLAHGPSNTTATYVDFSYEKGTFDIGLHIPVIRTESQYDLKGNILLLPLVGVGDAKLSLKNVTTDVHMKISFPKVQGTEVMKVEDMQVDFKLTSCRIHLENLFNGNKVLGLTVNNFLNKHSLEVVDELKENVGDGLTFVFKKVMNDAFGRVPLKYWLEV